MQKTDQTQVADNIRQHLPQTPDEYEKYLAEKFYRILNSPQCAFYDGFLEDYYRIPQESDEFPGWILPMRNDVAAVIDSGEWLTTKWFRILDAPKIRGHENTQAVHPVWQEVQEAFRAYFPGINGVRREIQPNRKRRLSCESMPLIKQAGGCLATAIALQFGKQPTKQQLMHLVTAVLATIDDRMLERTNERAEEFQVKTGVECGGYMV